MATGCFPHQFEGSFSAFKERQLVFDLTRQLAAAQFVDGDQARSERLWQEAAAEAMDPERIIRLLYGVHDHDDSTAMEALDRPYRDLQRQAQRRARTPFARLARFKPGPPRRKQPAPGCHPSRCCRAGGVSWPLTPEMPP